MAKKARKVTNKESLVLRIEQEIKTGYRTKELDGKVVRIYLPSGKDKIEINNFRDRVTSRLYKDEDLLTQDEALDILRKRGTWDADKQKQEQKLRERMSQCLADVWLEHAKDDPNKETLEELERERLSIQIDLLTLSANKDKLFESTIEKRIEDDVNSFTFILCLKDEEENRIFNSLDELFEYKDQDEIEILKSEALFFWHRLDPSMFGIAPIVKSEDSEVGAEDSENLQDHTIGN